MRKTWKAAVQQPSLWLVCLLSIALGFSLAANYYHSSTPAIASPATALGTPEWRSVFEDIASKLAPSVVNIKSEKMVEVSGFPGMEDIFKFGPFGSIPKGQGNEKQLSRATGTGVIVRADGYIMTNDHVVGGADRVTVRLNDGREFNGTVLGDRRTDLALVKIDAKDLPTAEFADSDKTRVGQWVMAIGNPFRLRNTVTVGVVSAIRRETDPRDIENDQLPYNEAIQTDASINPGNSGGPLVDINGKVVGINGAIYSTSGGNMGIGFAIPSNTAKFVMDQLISKGKVVRGYLGLMPTDITPVLADKLGAKQGALVESMDKDSPAEKAGIKVKDIITKVNAKQVTNAVALRTIVQAIAPETEVKLTLIRDKKEMTLNVKLGEAPNPDEDGTEIGSGDKIGLSVQPLTPEIAQQLGIDDSIEGVVVRNVSPGSAADRAGIRPRDIITEIDDTPVTSVASLAKATKSLKSGDTAIVVVQRKERSVIIEMPID